MVPYPISEPPRRDPPVIHTQTKIAEVEVDRTSKAYAWAMEQLVKHSPGAADQMTRLQNYVEQYNAGQNIKGKS